MCLDPFINSSWLIHDATSSTNQRAAFEHALSRGPLLLLVYLGSIVLECDAETPTVRTLALRRFLSVCQKSTSVGPLLTPSNISFYQIQDGRPLAVAADDLDS